MGEARQGLSRLVLPVMGSLTVPQMDSEALQLPVVGYPCNLEYIKCTPVGLGAGTWDFALTDANQFAVYVDIRGRAPSLKIDFNYSRPLPVGGFFLQIGDVFDFGNGHSGPPPVGVVSLNILPAVVGNANLVAFITNNTNADGVFTIEMGISLVGRGLDLEPQFFPGLGPAAVVSSSNI